MANQLKMADVQAIQALFRLGWSYRRIARELGVDRDTVSRHARQEPACGANAAMALTGSADVPPASNAAIALTGSAEGASTANAAMALTGSFGGRPHLSAAWPWREVIKQKLEQGLDGQRIYQDLIDPDQHHGYAGSYHSVRRLIQKFAARRELPVRRMECAAGQEAQVDFGRGAPVIGADSRRRTTWVFRIVLSHCRKGYSEAVFRQSTDDFLRCLENAFACFGGVSRTLVIDNLRAAVSRADWFDPELCPKVRSFAEHYGIAILPTRPYTPRHKGKIENGVKYVKRNALKGRTFTSLQEQNRHLEQWEATVADTRIHGTTRRQVQEQFLAIEKPALLPLPAGRFELFHEALRTVHRDGHVQVKGAYYSVPPEYLGQELWARWDGRMVRLYDRKMRPIAVHAQLGPGRFATQSAHLHPHKISVIEKGAEWMLGRIEGIGPKSLAWAQAMLQSRGIEGVRVLMGLLNLLNKHSRQEIEQACCVALGHGAYHLRSLRQLIEHQNRDPTPAQPIQVQQHFAFAQEHEIIRPLADYGQWLQDALRRQPTCEDVA
jgi:transposase